VETIRLDRGLARSAAPNGLTVLSEHLPGVRSAAIGVWVRTASAHESRPLMGVSHLLEHMVFKGTERRTARQLALALESRGGSLDAFTSRDHTAYQAHVLDLDLPRAVDVLTDLVRRPLLRNADLELERKVVLEEISTVDDTPDDLVHELFAEHLFPSHPYGYSILGTRDSVSAVSADDLRSVHGTGYYAGNCVVAAAGQVDHDRLLEMLATEGWFEGDQAVPPRPPVAAGEATRGGELVVERESAQTHMVFGTDTFPYRDPRRFALAIVTNLFGGGMSSRLFQRVREELGLAYTVYAYQQLFQSAGTAGVYVGTQPASADKAADAIRDEFGRLSRHGLTAEEVAEGKQQFKGLVMLALESPQSRMNRLAGITLMQDRYRPLDQLLAEIDAVSHEEIQAVAAEYFAPERQVAVRLGPKA
jgi:predicted Zn-dependent peptidase